MHRSLRLFAVAVSLVAAAAAQEPKFATGTLAEARARAKEQRRGLVVDFSHDAIAPCRRLRDESWRAPEVWQALADVADVIRIDPEQDPAAAAEFALIAYPTLVVFGRDGAEARRFVGFRAASELRWVLAEAVDPPPTKWVARDKLAAKLAKAGDLDGAGRHYLWLWDEGVAHDPEFDAVRTSRFLTKLARFAKKHVPTMAALHQRRSALLAKAQGNDPDFEEMNTLVELTAALGDLDQLLQLRTDVPQRTWDQFGYAFGQLAERVLPQLVANKDFAAALPFVGEPLQSLEEQLGYLQMGGIDGAMLKMLIWSKVQEYKTALTVLFAAKDERAQQLADRMLEKDGGVRTWLLIMDAAKAAGADVVAHDWATKALQTLPEKDHGRVRAFLQRR